jgi:hypothetical protein
MTGLVSLAVKMICHGSRRRESGEGNRIEIIIWEREMGLNGLEPWRRRRGGWRGRCWGLASNFLVCMTSHERKKLQ